MSNAADAQLMQELAQDTGQFTAGTGIAAPGAATVAQWDKLGPLGAEAQNIGYYTSRDKNLPRLTRQQITQAAQQDPRWGEVDAQGQQILLELYNEKLSGYGGDIGANTPLPPQTPKPTGDVGIGGTPGTGGGFTPTQQSAWDTFSQTLSAFDFSPSDLAAITNWAKGQIVAGFSETQIALDFAQTQQFKNRFPGIAIREQNGLPPITPAEYIQNENAYTQILRQAGFPQGFYDTPQDFAQLIGNNVAPTEVQDRVSNIFDTVSTAPPEVQQAFGQFYGVNGKTALAMLTLDPSRAEPALLKQVQSAQVAGAGTQFGFGLDQATAQRMAALGIDYTAAQSGFKTASDYQSLIHGAINEPTPLGQQGVVAGQFGLTPGANVALEQAIRGRQSDFSGGGSALQTNTGISGLGTGRPI